MQNGNGSFYITAKDIRERFQIPYSKINHYTAIGLFSIVKKDGNKRIYDLTDVEHRYRVISKLASEGYPLVLIRKKLTEPVVHELL